MAKIYVICNHGTCVSLSAMLRYDGASVECIGHAPEAQLKILCDPPDLIVLDLHMSGPDGLDGFEMIGRVRGLQNRIPILLISTVMPINIELWRLADWIQGFCWVKDYRCGDPDGRVVGELCRLLGA